jgi:hypothetical protein
MFICIGHVGLPITGKNGHEVTTNVPLATEEQKHGRVTDKTHWRTKNEYPNKLRNPR